MTSTGADRASAVAKGRRRPATMLRVPRRGFVKTRATLPSSGQISSRGPISAGIDFVRPSDSFTGAAAELFGRLTRTRD
jgi:hypothetical protein